LKNGLYEGLWKYYYESGNIFAEGYYKNGEWNGKYTGYDDEGNILETGKHLNNQKHGKWTFYNKGKKEKTTVYKNGELMKEKKY